MADLIYTNTFEGFTDGSSITAPASGGASGDALANVQGTWTARAAAAFQGSVGAELAMTTSSQYVRGDDASASGRGIMRFMWYYPGTYPLVNTSVCGMRAFDGSSDIGLAAIGISTAGVLRLLVGNSGTALTASNSSPLPLTPGWMGFELAVTPGASASTAKIEFRAEDDSGSLFHTYETGADQNVGSTLAPNRYRFGTSSSSTGWSTYRLDTPRWGHKAEGWIGPLGSAPTLIVADARMIYELDLTDSNGDNPLSFSISHVSGPNNLTAVKEPIEGHFLIPADENQESVYNVVASDGVLSSNSNYTVPPSKASTDTIQKRYWDGTAWV